MATVELADKILSPTDFNILGALLDLLQEKFPVATATTEGQFPASVILTITGELDLVGE